MSVWLLLVFSPGVCSSYHSAFQCFVISPPGSSSWPCHMSRVSSMKEIDLCVQSLYYFVYKFLMVAIFTCSIQNCCGKSDPFCYSFVSPVRCRVRIKSEGGRVFTVGPRMLPYWL